MTAFQVFAKDFTKYYSFYNLSYDEKLGLQNILVTPNKISKISKLYIKKENYE